ncbi:hypothetical protein AB0N09_42765 [Streptomyces erythrochromogenes]|uniref:hypothetical protein n=1 Tax=Streptomyces erythrochromogenes TaxID=285574 RepID=UPI0034410C5C
MSPDLFHAIAQVVRRQTRNRRAIPLVSRYDPQERRWSDPMPFLFQRQLGTAHNVLAARTIAGLLRRGCNEIAQTNPVFADTKFTPHDDTSMSPRKSGQSSRSARQAQGRARELRAPLRLSLPA